MVKLSFQDKTVHLGVEYDRFSNHVVKAGTDSEDFTFSVEGELNYTGESDDSPSVSDSEKYVVAILSNTTAGKNIETDPVAAFVAQVVEEDEPDYGIPPLASDDDFSEIDEEMTESGDLRIEESVLVANIMQEHSNGEQDSSSAFDSIQHDIGESPFNCPDWAYDSDKRVWWVGPPTELPDTVEDFSDYDAYYLVGNSLERIQERCHLANPFPQIRDTSHSCVCDPLRSSLEE